MVVFNLSFCFCVKSGKQISIFFLATCFRELGIKNKIIPKHQPIAKRIGNGRKITNRHNPKNSHVVQYFGAKNINLNFGSIMTVPNREL